MYNLDTLENLLLAQFLTNFSVLLLYLTMEECAAIVRQRPTEFKILSDKMFCRSIAWNGLELFNQSSFGRVVCTAASP